MYFHQESAQYLFQANELFQCKNLLIAARIIQWKHWLSRLCNVRLLHQISSYHNATLINPGFCLTATVHILRWNALLGFFCFSIWLVLKNTEQKRFCAIACHGRAICHSSTIDLCTAYITVWSPRTWTVHFGFDSKKTAVSSILTKCENEIVSCCFRGLNFKQSASGKPYKHTRDVR